MLTSLWNFITFLLWNLPWLAIAIAAGIVFAKHGKSFTTGLQALGAIGVFLVDCLTQLTMWILKVSHAPWDVVRTATTILDFLLLVSLVLFAAAYCWEKFVQWRAKPAPAVPAIPLK